jgi:hypothetical protein
MRPQKEAFMRLLEAAKEVQRCNISDRLAAAIADAEEEQGPPPEENQDWNEQCGCEKQRGKGNEARGIFPTKGSPSDGATGMAKLLGYLPAWY